MREWREWDWPQEPRRRSRRPKVEILEPEPTPRVQRVEIIHHHRSRATLPHIVTIGSAILAALILLRAPTAILMMAVLVPPKVWIACGLAVALLVIIAIRERLAGRPF
jgi:hypothetical protein